LTKNNIAMISAQQARARGPIRSASRFASGNASGLVMPFDQAARFELKGIPGNIVQDVINISSDATFVAVAIGYGFEEELGRSVGLIPTTVVPNPAPPAGTFFLNRVRLSQVPVAALIEGFRLNPNFERLILEPAPANGGRRTVARERTLSKTPIPENFSGNIIEQLKPKEEISFLFSIVDSGTGRELQDEPIHNLAALGKSNGDRPFRMLAQPLTFQPHSSVRLQVVERSERLKGTLFIVLYGYKTLTGCEPGGAPLASLNSDSSRVMPFDYVTSVELTGSPGNLIEDEVPVNGEGGFVATTIGYGLAVESLDVAIGGIPTVDPPLTVDLGAIEFGQFPTSSLQGGIRIRPNFLRIALDSDSALTSVPVDSVNRIFERLNRPDDVSFRYSIFDTGSGRELQNQPINNIAGLGIANGDRPFKRLARPMLFQPRSSIRVAVEERSGKGTLFIVFQGYKLLSSVASIQTPTPARRTRRR
jgi:hypothetical protein